MRLEKLLKRKRSASARNRRIDDWWFRAPHSAHILDWVWNFNSSKLLSSAEKKPLSVPVRLSFVQLHLRSLRFYENSYLNLILLID